MAVGNAERFRLKRDCYYIFSMTSLHADLLWYLHNGLDTKNKTVLMKFPKWCKLVSHQYRGEAGHHIERMW